jgi:hypothetical protein
MRRICVSLLLCLAAANAQPANWTANDPPCRTRGELLKKAHMDLGLRVATANPNLAEQFRRALDSWSRVLDLDWHEDNTENCSIQLIDGARALFRPTSIVARSQLPDRRDFQGSVAFNPGPDLSDTELYKISVHEIGHMLGLQHSSNPMSVMYAFDLEGMEWLYPSDLADLAKHHKLRITRVDRPVSIGDRSAAQTSRNTSIGDPGPALK